METDEVIVRRVSIPVDATEVRLAGGANLHVEKGVLEGEVLIPPDVDADECGSDRFFCLKLRLVDKNGVSLIYCSTQSVADLIEAKTGEASEWDGFLEQEADLRFEGYVDEGFTLVYRSEDGSEQEEFVRKSECIIDAFIEKEGCQTYMEVEGIDYIAISRLIPWSVFLWKQADTTYLDDISIQGADYVAVEVSGESFEIELSSCVEFIPKP